MRPVVPLLATAVLAAAGGWLCGAPGGNRNDRLTSAPSSPVAPAPGTVTELVKVSAMDAPEVAARLEKLLHTTAGNRVELRLLMARWVETDLPAAKEWALRQPHGSTGTVLSEFFTAWSRLDPVAAVDATAELNPAKSGTAMRAVVEGLAGAGLDVVSTVLNKLPGSESWEPYGVLALVKQLAGRDLAGAQSLALSLSGQRGKAAVQAVAEVLARTDPQSALAWAQQAPDDAARTGAVTAVLTEWAQRDPASVGPLLVRKTEGEPDQFFPDAAVSALRQLGATDPAAAAAFIEKYLPPQHIKANLQALYDVLGSTPESPGAAAVLCACVSRLSPEDLGDTRLFRNNFPFYESLRPAWEALLSEPDSPAKRFLLSKMGQEMISQRPVEVMQELLRFPDAALGKELLTAALNGTGSFELSDTGGPAARQAEIRAVVDSLPEDLRPRALLRLSWRIADDDPVAAAAMIKEHPALMENLQYATHLTSSFISHTSPAEAQRWADSLPDGAAKANACSGIIDAWWGHDPEASAQWLNTLPPGASRDAGAGKLTHILAYNGEPDAAMIWAASIQDAAQRRTAAAVVVQRMAEFDPSRTREMVTGSTLTEQEKADLLSLLNQNR